MGKYFRVASFDAPVYVNTILYIVGLVFFLGKIALSLANGSTPELFDVGVSLALLLMVAVAAIRSVKGYLMSAGEIVVERRGPGKVLIPLEKVLSAEATTTLGGFFRPSFLSLQGLFGWTGPTQVRNTTDVNSLKALVYGTRAANTVVLKLTNDRTVLLTPADVQGFVQALREAGVQPPGGGGQWLKPGSTAAPAKSKKKQASRR